MNFESLPPHLDPFKALLSAPLHPDWKNRNDVPLHMHVNYSLMVQNLRIGISRSWLSFQVIQATAKDQDYLAEVLVNQTPEYIMKLSEGIIFGLESLLDQMIGGFEDYCLALLDLLIWIKRHVEEELKPGDFPPEANLFRVNIKKYPMWPENAWASLKIRYSFLGSFSTCLRQAFSKGDQGKRGRHLS